MLKVMHDWIHKKIAKKQGRFLTKLEKSAKFSPQEKIYIQEHLNQGKTQQVVHIFFVFLVLTGLSSLFDVLTLLFSALFSYIQGEANFWPFFLFLVGSGVFKVWYAHITLDKFRWYDKILSTLPYVGAGLLLAKGLKNEPVVAKSLWLFLKKKL